MRLLFEGVQLFFKLDASNLTVHCQFTVTNTSGFDGTFSLWALFNQRCLQLATKLLVARMLERKFVGQW